MLAAIILLSALFLTCLVMAAAMTIAWASFGRPRHARSWGLAFGAGAAQSLVNAGAVAIGHPTVVMLLAFMLVVVPAPLIAIGARQRRRLHSYKHGFAAAAAGAGVTIAIGYAVPGLAAIGLTGATVFSGGCLLIAARTIRPDARAAQPAERAMHAALILLATAHGATGLATWAHLVLPQSDGLRRAYEAVLSLALPPAILCTGVAAILLVASDLAVELGWQAARDALTCVYNRRGFQDGATRALAAARRLRVPVALVLADIDHFKAVNDRHGHAAGDRTLCLVAAALERGVRQGDIVARIGGEEFALLLVDSGAEQARDAIDRIRIAIAAGFADDGAPAPVPAPVTVSFGIGAIRYDRDDPAALLAAAFDAADRALYLSKIGGRNRVTVAD